MAPKRPAEPQSSTDRKRTKARELRTIPLQHPPRAGGSHAQGNAGLPSTIEVEKFAQARSFEIAAMQRAIKSAKAAGTQRAFQSLPRHLRRRAASHNIRRLPLRLRAKALSETPKDAAKPKKKTRKMLGRKRLLSKLHRPTLLLKRQRVLSPLSLWLECSKTHSPSDAVLSGNKIWLETHIWHAKRMHMMEIWGHRLAEKPTEKAFRSSYRASVHGALVHDASYFQYLELVGSFSDVGKVLEALCHPSEPSPTSKRYTSGTRECTASLWSPITAAIRPRLIGPATIIWNTPEADPLNADEAPRQVLVRLHPAICTEVADWLERIVRLFKVPVRVNKFEKELLTFEITGKRATEVIKAVLKPVATTSKETLKAWKSLSSVAGPSSVPKGMIFGLEVYDPRISFPPKLDRSNPTFESMDDLQPSAQIAQVLPFWKSEVRSSLRQPRYRKSEIDARRSQVRSPSSLLLFLHLILPSFIRSPQLLIPGSPLLPTASDDRIPLLLSQRTLSPTSSTSSEMCGWTLTVPCGWGMAFWQSLVFSETRVGGLRERSQQIFEAGSPRFPEDYPGTKAFEQHETCRAADDESYFLRRPPAKRPNFVKLGIENPFKANFEAILELGKQGRAWIVPSSVVRIALGGEEKGASKGVVVLARQLREERAAEERDERPRIEVMPVLPGALVRVRILPCSRGTPEELGIVYALDEENWGRAVEFVKGLKKGETEADDGELQLTGEHTVIGRVTTGSFSLRLGRGYAVGAVSFNEFMNMAERDQRLPANAAFKYLALARNRDSNIFRPVTLEVMP